MSNSKITAVLLWPVLFAFQLTLVAVITILAGGMVNTKSAPPPVAVEFVLALVGIPVGIVAYRWKVLRSSGKWIWTPGIVGIIYDAARFGLQVARQEFLSKDSVGTAITIVTAACAVYSLTMWLLPFSRWELSFKDGKLSVLARKVQ